MTLGSPVCRHWHLKGEYCMHLQVWLYYRNRGERDTGCKRMEEPGRGRMGSSLAKGKYSRSGKKKVHLHMCRSCATEWILLGKKHLVQQLTSTTLKTMAMVTTTVTTMIMMMTMTVILTTATTANISRSSDYKVGSFDPFQPCIISGFWFCWCVKFSQFYILKSCQLGSCLSLLLYLHFCCDPPKSVLPCIS